MSNDPIYDAARELFDTSHNSRSFAEVKALVEKHFGQDQLLKQNVALKKKTDAYDHLLKHMVDDISATEHLIRNIK